MAKKGRVYIGGNTPIYGPDGQPIQEGNGVRYIKTGNLDINVEESLQKILAQQEQARKNKNWEALGKLQEQQKLLEEQIAIEKIDKKIQNLHTNTEEIKERYYSQKLYNLQFVLVFLYIMVAISILFLAYIIFRNKIKNLIIRLTEKLKSMKSEIPKNKQNIKEIAERYISKMDNNDIIIVSVVISTLVATILGYCTGETLYFYNNGNRGSLKHHHYSEFHINYFASIIGFITAGGLSYLFLKKKRK